MEGNQKIKVALNNGKNITVEIVQTDKDYPKEIIIGIEDDKGNFLQDIAIVRQSYHYCPTDTKVIPEDNKVDVLVYADENDEDYTDSFKISVLDDEDED